jgi:hypothetical protein
MREALKLRVSDSERTAHDWGNPLVSDFLVSSEVGASYAGRLASLPEGASSGHLTNVIGNVTSSTL